MDVTDRDDSDAGHGYDEFAVLLDALDVAFGTLVDAVSYAHAVAGAILRRVGAEIFHVPAGTSGSDQDEGPHFLVADRAGLAAPGLRIEHEVCVVFFLEFHEPFFRAAHEKQRGDKLFFDIDQPPAFKLFDGLERDIRLHSLGFKEGFQVHHPVVKHFQRVPVLAFRRWFDQMGRHVAGHFSYSPTLLRRSAG